MMKVFEDAVRDTKSVPSKEKEHWISSIQAGDQDPVIALLFPRLHYLTHLLITLRDQEDLFMRKALHRIAKDPRSLFLSRLRKVSISGTFESIHRLELVTVCAALPSLILLGVGRLLEELPDCARSAIEIAPSSSSVRGLDIDHCCLSANALFNLIRSAKSLRSLKYTCSGRATHKSFAWVRAAVLQYASTSIEELTLRRSHYDPDWSKAEFSFKSYRNLRVLTIDYALVMGDKFHATDRW